ncbi:hypothetical protein M4L39_13655 [Staphylococcus equorum]|uniref:hypothetical protein n=1 Tax=Staphylococcus equorum TaxID=246432 RepID=UPI0024085A5C|nr:hypothetical protein [Staphylococcus equorum]MDG0844459.1 hypothetical protein [Staphylococcus equorum]
MPDFDRFADLESKMNASNEEEERKKRHNEVRRKVPSYQDRTTIVLNKQLKPLFNALAHENHENRRDFANKLLMTYAKEKYPEYFKEYVENYKNEHGQDLIKDFGFLNKKEF